MIKYPKNPKITYCAGSTQRTARINTLPSHLLLDILKRRSVQQFGYRKDTGRQVSDEVYFAIQVLLVKRKVIVELPKTVV